ncbi:MAG: hypothetical protein QNK23_08145 [Crocinitomicaceae bacterium]|nr:hypothetical protein [Crocinitomicaceae bacterium]
MTTEKENTDIFHATLLSERVVDNVTLRLYSNRIFYVHIPQFEKIGIDMIKAGYQFLDDNGGGTFYNVYHFDSFSDVDPETREWAAASDGNHYTICDALVIGGLSQKIITDFYLRFNKPVKPTKVFYSLEKAVKWTIEQMGEESSK